MKHLQADFSSHHIEGFAHMADDDGYFSTSLVTQIQGNLWTGGCIGGVRLPDDFEFVVSLYPWEKYELGSGTTRIEFQMFDSGNLPDPQELEEIADIVRFYVSQGQTLVHCQAGLNRSGLVAGLSLVRGGMAPARAVELLREARSPAVLCNPAFHAWLLEQGSVEV